MVGGSLVLVGASAIALLIGWVNAAPELIWASIVASVGAGVLLALAYVRSGAEGAALAAGPEEAADPRAANGCDPTA